MATEATGTQPRKPPIAPSARNSSPRQSSVRPARRTSNHPPPLAGLTPPEATPSVSAQPKAKTSHVVTSVASHSNAHHGNASLPVSEVRDELVRVVMPELRVLMEHLVAGAVERSLAPLLEKQRELEESIKELRSAQVRSAQAAAATTKPAVEMASARAIAVDPRPVAPVSPAVYREAVPVDVVTYREAPVTAPAQPNRETKGNVYQAPHRAARLDSMEDIPSELNGSRRKKLLMVAFAVALFVLILSAVGLSVMSNLGTHL